MNSTWKRSFAMLLSLVMVFGMLPVNAFATGEGGECSHVYSETVTTAATCTTEGVKTFTCGNCGHSYTEGIAVDTAAHSYSSAVTAPTCEAAGYTTYTCACGDNYTADEVAATGHSYGEDGKCAACGAEKPAEVHTHSFDELVSDTATCTEAGVKTTKCSCGETTETESPAKGHSFSDGVADPVATCAVSGELTKTCNVCGTTETEVLPATGAHVYENGACVVCTAAEPKTCEEGCWLPEGHDGECEVVCQKNQLCVLDNGHEGVCVDCNGVTLEVTVGSGTVAGCFIMNPDSNSYITTAIQDVYATESIVLKLTDAEGNLLAASTLVDNDHVLLGKSNSEISGTILISATDAWWDTVWTKGNPRADHVPATITLYVDGDEKNSTPALIRNNVEVSLVWGDVNGVLPAPVATITRGDEEIDYGTLAAALTDAKDGETIELVWKEGNAPIAMNGAVFGKSVTITGTATVDWSKGNLFVGRGGEGNGTVIFDNAKLTSASNNASTGIHVSGREKGTTDKYDGTLILNDSAIELDYLINKGNMTLNNSTLTVKNGFSVGGRPASETETGTDATATLTLNDSYLTVNNHNGMGLGYEAIGVMNVNSGSTFKTTQSFLITEKGTMNVNGGSVNVTGILTNNGATNVYGESTLNIDTVAGKNTVDFMDGAIIKDSTVGGSVFVAGNVTFRGDNEFAMLYDFGTLTDNYGTTANMEWTVEAGASVTLTEKARYGLGYGDNVTINGNLTDAMSARSSLTTEDASLFMHGLVAQESSGWNQSSSLTVNDAYVVIGSNNSFGNKPGNYGGTYTITIDNSVVDASRITFYEATSKTTFSINKSDVKIGTFMTNDADSVFTLTDSTVLSTTTTNGNDEGNYNAGQLILSNTDLTYSAAVTNKGTVTLKNGSKLTAPEVVNTEEGAKIQIDGSAGYKDGDVVIDVTTTAFTEDTFKNIEVINNGALKAVLNVDGDVVLESAAAQVGDTYYDDLQDAIDAADGKTVKLLKDVTLTDTITIEKAVTLDLNGKTITGDADADALVIKAETTIKNGTITADDDLIVTYADLALENVSLTAGKYYYAVEVKNGAETVTLTDCTVDGPLKGYYTADVEIRSGTYKVTESYYSDYLNGTFAISGGTFHYEIDETECAPGYAPVDNGDGTYTVKYAVVCFIDADEDGVWDEGETYYANLDQVFANHTEGEVNVVLTSDVVANGKVDTDADAVYNFTTNVDGGVKMDFLYADDWNYVQKMSVGENITLNVPYLATWTDFDVYGTVNTGYYYSFGSDTTVHEGGVLNVTTGDATVQVKDATMTVKGTVNAGTLNVWQGNSSLTVTGENAKVEADWLDCWDTANTILVEDGATLETGSMQVRTSNTLTVDGATLSSGGISLGYDGGGTGTLIVKNESYLELTDDGVMTVPNGGSYSIDDSSTTNIITKITHADGSATYYTKLSAAIAAAGEGDDITPIGNGPFDADPTPYLEEGYQGVETEEGWYIEKKMSSGDEYYDSLDDMLKDGVTSIEIPADTKDPANYTVNGNHTYTENLTIDANGNAIIGSGSITAEKSAVIEDISGTDVAINSGKITFSNTGATTFAPSYQEDKGWACAEVTTTDGKGNKSTIYYYLDRDATLTVDADGNVTFSGKYISGDENGPDYRIGFSQNEPYDNKHYLNNDPNMIVTCNGFYGSVENIWITGGQYGKKVMPIFKEGAAVNGFKVDDEGSTVVTLSKGYLNSLEEGDYTIHFQYKDHADDESVSDVFKVRAKSSSTADPTNPKTGDSIMMAVSVMAVSAAAMATLLILNKKKHTMI